MAAMSLAAPGTEAGPCLDSGCGHRYCRLCREAAREPCGYCGEKIGYDRRHYVTQGLGSVHATCHEAAVEEAMEEERKGRSS